MQGSVYQKTNAMSEIRKTNKDNFWAQAEVGSLKLQELLIILWEFAVLKYLTQMTPFTYSLIEKKLARQFWSINNVTKVSKSMIVFLPLRAVFVRQHLSQLHLESGAHCLAIPFR